MSSLVERLRNGIGMPSQDDGAFRWYAEITDEAANEIERLQTDLAAREEQLSEAVSAVQRLSAGQPFDAVVIADGIKRGVAEVLYAHSKPVAWRKCLPCRKTGKIGKHCPDCTPLYTHPPTNLWNWRTT